MNPLPPSFERILVTNDDGINASGLKALEEIAHSLSDDVWVVAPETEQSGAGHSLTLTQALRVMRIDDKKFAVRGTPTDCVMLATNHVIKDKRPTLVLSGVNRGINLGEDVTYSGTVAGAIEGTLTGISSIALSQARDTEERRADFSPAVKFAPDIIRKLVGAGWSDDVLFNINFPALSVDEVKGVKVTTLGKRDLAQLNVEKRVDPRGYPYYWFGMGRGFSDPGEETDLHVVRDGYISVTPLHLDLTHYETRNDMKGLLEGDF